MFLNLQISIVPSSAPGDWNYPDIYQLIQQAGQTVVATDVLTVFANNPNWTLTTIFVEQGENLWIDLRADGLWTFSPGKTPENANGYPGIIYAAQMMPNVPACTLIGQVGNGAMFAVGTTDQNYAPGQTGTLGLMNNDSVGYNSDDSGFQTVRVILTR